MDSRSVLSIRNILIVLRTEKKKIAFSIINWLPRDTLIVNITLYIKYC